MRHGVVECQLCGELGTGTTSHLASCLVLRCAVVQLQPRAPDPGKGPQCVECSRLLDRRVPAGPRIDVAASSCGRARLLRRVPRWCNGVCVGNGGLHARVAAVPPCGDPACCPIVSPEPIAARQVLYLRWGGDGRGRGAVSARCTRVGRVQVFVVPAAVGTLVPTRSSAKLGKSREYPSRKWRRPRHGGDGPATWRACVPKNAHGSQRTFGGTRRCGWKRWQHSIGTCGTDTPPPRMGRPDSWQDLAHDKVRWRDLEQTLVAQVTKVKRQPTVPAGRHKLRPT